MKDKSASHIELKSKIGFNPFYSIQSMLSALRESVDVLIFVFEVSVNYSIRNLIHNFHSAVSITSCKIFQDTNL
jgi:hypothetical protein